MNEQIDWSRAPEGAEAGSLGTSHAYDAWYKRDANGEVLQICSAAGFNDWVSMGGRKDFPVGAVMRPVTPVWVGVGPPPVGTVCDVKLKGVSVWCPAAILFCQDNALVLSWQAEGIAHPTTLDSVELRPILTPEQRAAEVLRAKYMPQLIKLWDADTERTEFLEAVYGLIVEASKP